MIEFDPYKATIKQLLLANGWYAVYAEGDGEAKVTPCYVPLAAWALVEISPDSENTIQKVTGITFEGSDTHNQFCENRRNFLGYTKKDDPFALTDADWREEAQDYLERESERQQSQIRIRQQDDQRRR